jgi:hypothetical protein
VLASAEWLRSLPHRHKLVIAGNHDFCLQQQDPRQLLQGLIYYPRATLRNSRPPCVGHPLRL